jgi:hypothetical protein
MIAYSSMDSVFGTRALGPIFGQPMEVPFVSSAITTTMLGHSPSGASQRRDKINTQMWKA